LDNAYANAGAIALKNFIVVIDPTYYPRTGRLLREKIEAHFDLPVKFLFLTHSHADHVGGLEEIALLGRYSNKRKAIMVINEAYQHLLWDMSMRGGVAYNEEEASIMLSFESFFDIVRPTVLTDYPRETFGANIGDIDIKMIRTKHIPDSSSDWMGSFWSCGVIIDDRIMFTSDTRFDHDLLYRYEKRFNFEAIFHDCQFYTGGVHASLEELNQLPVKYKNKTYLSHYGDDWEDFLDMVNEFGFAGLAKQHVYYNFDKKKTSYK